MTFEDPLSRLIAQRCGDNFKHLPESPPTEERTTFPLDFEDGLDIPLNMDVTDMSDLLGTSDISDFSELLGLQPEDLLWDGGSATTAASKRKSCHDTCPNRAVRPRTESDGVTDDLTALRNIMTRSPCHSSSEEIRQDSAISQSCALELAPKEYQAVDRGQSASPCSDMSDQSFVGQSVEFHFQKIQDHINLAIDALRQSQYEHKKGIVTWDHELKNKDFSELKKEAERAWDADKDKDAAPNMKAKNMHGSTKRVEQFRKNMRRWMIGIQAHNIGVEWMVYARMEHLLAIAKFILGDAMPQDPASPTAVAESIMMFLGHELTLEFVDAELAEPEPGKRYSIGPQLATELQAGCSRKVPTLAFTMPPDGDDVGTAAWLVQLKSLFPVKPLPKAKATQRPAR